jgi:hypothetical protein
MPLATVPQPRLMPVSADVRALGMRKGDLLAVVPLDEFRGDGVYVITIEGTPTPVRCTINRQRLLDVESLYRGGGSATMSREQFYDLLLGQVLAACKVLDHTLLAPTR